MQAMERTNLQLISVTCLLIAAKFEEVSTPVICNLALSFTVSSPLSPVVSAPARMLVLAAKCVVGTVWA